VGENDKQRTRGCVFLQKFSPAKKAGINHHRFLYGQGRDQKTKARKHTRGQKSIQKGNPYQQQGATP